MHCTVQWKFRFMNYIYYVLLYSVSSRVHATFWLGTEQCSNQYGNLVPDESGPRFAWHTYQKPGQEKRSWFMAPASGACVTGISLPEKWQEAQLPQRDSASATHVFLGSLTDRALHWAPHLFYNYIIDWLNSYRHYQPTNRATYAL